MRNFLSLVVLKVVDMTIFFATSDNKVGIMTILGFHWHVMNLSDIQVLWTYLDKMLWACWYEEQFNEKNQFHNITLKCEKKNFF